MDKTSAETLANYLLNGSLPTAAALDSGGRTVDLTFGSTVEWPQRCSDLLTITANVLDINGRSNVSTAAAAVTANTIDTAGPTLSGQQGRVWPERHCLHRAVDLQRGDGAGIRPPRWPIIRWPAMRAWIP